MNEKTKAANPSSDNPFDVIDSITLTVKDDKTDNPCKLKLYTSSYTRDLKKGIVIPYKFQVEHSGECRRKMKGYVDVLSKVGKFIKTSSIFKNPTVRRTEAIIVMVNAYKKNPDALAIKFKVIPVRGNKEDYGLINRYFEI